MFGDCSFINALGDSESNRGWRIANGSFAIASIYQNQDSVTLYAANVSFVP
jgi:hypothetical protein